MNLLETNEATIQFGGLTAVNKLSIEAHEGEIVSIIGPNGAGKTTAFNMITGEYVPTSGTIAFRGKEIQGTRADRITKLGIARTFQNIHLFQNLSALDNVLSGCHLRLKSDLFSSVLGLPGARKEEAEMRAFSQELLERTGLAAYTGEIATNLPYGLQRRLEIARALATKPTLLLLDEPAAGMNPKESEDLTAFIRQIRDEFNLTILLIEHHMQLIMDISDRIYVLEYGNTIAQGKPEEIVNDPVVVRAYLGEED